MNVEFDESFFKSIEKIKDKNVAKKIESLILSIRTANKIQDISNLKKLEGYKQYYRIRIGDYRLGIRLIDNQTVS